MKKPVSEIAFIISGGTPKTSIEEYWDGPIAWLSVKDFNNGMKYVSDAEKSITELGLNNSAATLLETGDIIISARGTVGAMAKVSKPMAFNQSCFGLRAKEGIDQDYLYYALKNKVRELSSLSQGSVFSTINRTSFEKWFIDLPDTATQRTISSVLDSIDAKIALNATQNDYLAELLEALCKKLVEECADSPCSKIGEICDVFTGKLNANQFDENGTYPFFTCGEKSLRINSYIFDGPAIIVSGNGSYTGRTQFYEGKFNLYQRTYACTLKENQDITLIYALYPLIKTQLHRTISGGTHGSSIPYIVKGDLTDFAFPFDKGRYFEFGKTAKSILNNIQANNLESERLAELRDTLLPKLISGEIDVSKVELTPLNNHLADC